MKHRNRYFHILTINCIPKGSNQELSQLQLHSQSKSPSISSIGINGKCRKSNKKKHESFVLFKSISKMTFKRNSQPTCDQTRITECDRCVLSIDEENGVYLVIESGIGHIMGCGLDLCSRNPWRPTLVWCYDNDSQFIDQNQMKFILYKKKSFKGSVSIKWKNPDLGGNIQFYPNTTNPSDTIIPIQRLPITNNNNNNNHNHNTIMIPNGVNNNNNMRLHGQQNQSSTHLSRQTQQMHALRSFNPTPVTHTTRTNNQLPKLGPTLAALRANGINLTHIKREPQTHTQHNNPINQNNCQTQQFEILGQKLITEQQRQNARIRQQQQQQNHLQNHQQMVQNIQVSQQNGPEINLNDYIASLGNNFVVQQKLEEMKAEAQQRQQRIQNEELKLKLLQLSKQTQQVQQLNQVQQQQQQQQQQQVQQQIAPNPHEMIHVLTPVNSNENVGNSLPLTQMKIESMQTMQTMQTGLNPLLSNNNNNNNLNNSINGISIINAGVNGIISNPNGNINNNQGAQIIVLSLPTTINSNSNNNNCGSNSINLGNAVTATPIAGNIQTLQGLQGSIGLEAILNKLNGINGVNNQVNGISGNIRLQIPNMMNLGNANINNNVGNVTNIGSIAGIGGIGGIGGVGNFISTPRQTNEQILQQTVMQQPNLYNVLLQGGAV